MRGDDMEHDRSTPLVERSYTLRRSQWSKLFAVTQRVAYVPPLTATLVLESFSSRGGHPEGGDGGARERLGISGMVPGCPACVGVAWWFELAGSARGVCVGVEELGYSVPEWSCGCRGLDSAGEDGLM